jgi:hypothetical protein
MAVMLPPGTGVSVTLPEAQAGSLVSPAPATPAPTPAPPSPFRQINGPDVVILPHLDTPQQQQPQQPQQPKGQPTQMQRLRQLRLRHK